MFGQRRLASIRQRNTKMAAPELLSFIRWPERWTLNSFGCLVPL
jgi:hypothetical protein